MGRVRVVTALRSTAWGALTTVRRHPATVRRGRSGAGTPGRARNATTPISTPATRKNMPGAAAAAVWRDTACSRIASLPVTSTTVSSRPTSTWRRGVPETCRPFLPNGTGNDRIAPRRDSPEPKTGSPDIALVRILPRRKGTVNSTRFPLRSPRHWPVKRHTSPMVARRACCSRGLPETNDDSLFGVVRCSA